MGLSKKHLLIPLAATIGIGAGVITNVAADSGARTSPSGAPSVPLVAHLKGGTEEVPAPGDPDGFGFAIVNASPARGEVCIQLTTTNVGPWTLAHIHRAGVGSAGPVVVDFAVSGTETGPELTKCVTANATLINEIIADPAGYYVNVHTAQFPAGAVRGQVAARSSETQFNPVPVRVYDSRDLAAGKIKVDETRQVDLQLPVGVRAGIITVTVTETEVGGFLTVYAGGVSSVPNSSTVNWTTSGTAVATTTFAAVDENGRISITAGQNATHVIVDVIGFVI
jgi:hypothetical protein